MKWLIFLIAFFTFTTINVFSQITENFQSWTSRTSYGTYTQTTSSGVFSMTQAIVSPTATANGVGSIGLVQLNGATANNGTDQGKLTLPTINTCGIVTLIVRSSGSTPPSSGDFFIEKSTNNGTTWTTVQSFSNVSLTATQYSANVNDVSSSVIIRINGDNVGNTSNRRTMYIYDISVTKITNINCSSVESLSIPLTVGSTTTTGIQTTCGRVNDFPAGSFANASPGTSYGGGEDAVWEITIPSGGRNLQFNLGGTATYKILSLHSSCTPSSSNVLTYGTTSSGTSTSFSRVLEPGTYFLWVDTWPAPNCGEYSITLTRLVDPLPPNCVSSPTSPTNNQTNVSLTPTLSWSSVVDATSYDVYFGNPLPESPTTNTSSTSYSPGTLLGGTTYYWKIVPKNTMGSATGCNTWSFTTLTPVANDDPSTATTLIINDGLGYKTYTNVNSNSTTTESTPTCASYTGEDVWFKVVVPNGITTLDFDTQTGGITDGGMSIYRGTIGSLTQIECDDDDGLDGLMPWIYREDFTPGETIYIRFWEYGAGTTGTFKILVSSPTPLPVELIQFDGIPYPQWNVIKWSTASEQNSSHFDLEMSTDGENWRKITTRFAAGNSTEEIKYSYIDYNLNSLVYYRLQQFDNDGQFKTYGPIVITKTITNKKIIKYINLMGQEVNPKVVSGIIIEIYDDGTMRKIIR